MVSVRIRVKRRARVEDLKLDRNATRTVKNPMGTPEDYYRATRDDLDDLHEKVSREVGKVGGKVFFPLVTLLVLRANTVWRGVARVVRHRTEPCGPCRRPRETGRPADTHRGRRGAYTLIVYPIL